LRSNRKQSKVSAGIHCITGVQQGYNWGTAEFQWDTAGIQLKLKVKGGLQLDLKDYSRDLVPDHDGGRPIEVNACILITHMVYL
jgi:hypothetical protein